MFCGRFGADNKFFEVRREVSRLKGQSRGSPAKSRCIKKSISCFRGSDGDARIVYITSRSLDVDGIV